LHVLGHAHRIAGEIDAARRHHRRALGLASRIGHAAATCEAVEDLARDEATTRPGLAAMLLRVAQRERVRVGLPLRQRDAQELAALEQSVSRHAEPGVEDGTFSDVVAEMAV
jgi:hypothetical protein